MDTPRDDLELVWRALANPLRRRILDCLRDGALTTGKLAEHFPDHSRFAVMQHLRVLEEGGLVIQRKVGRQKFNHLNPIPVQQIYDRWVSRYKQAWTESLIALKDEVEAGDNSKNPRAG